MVVQQLLDSATTKTQSMWSVVVNVLVLLWLTAAAILVRQESNTLALQRLVVRC